MNIVYSFKWNAKGFAHQRGEDLANNTLTDKELLNQFKKIDQFSNEDKNVVKVFLDAFITKRRVQELAG